MHTEQAGRLAGGGLHLRPHSRAAASGCLPARRPVEPARRRPRVLITNQAPMNRLDERASSSPTVWSDIVAAAAAAAWALAPATSGRATAASPLPSASAILRDHTMSEVAKQAAKDGSTTSARCTLHEQCARRRVRQELRHTAWCQRLGGQPRTHVLSMSASYLLP